MMAFLLKWLLLFHPFYVSVVEIDHNATTSNLQISIRTFTTDMEGTLRKIYPSAKVDLLNTSLAQQQADDALIKRYVLSHFALQIDGKNYPLQFIGRENLEENTWSYFEVAGIKSIKKLHVTNRLLYDWKTEQSNMHVVKYGGKQKTYKLDNPDSEVDFAF